MSDNVEKLLEDLGHGCVIARNGDYKGLELAFESLSNLIDLDEAGLIDSQSVSEANDCVVWTLNVLLEKEPTNLTSWLRMNLDSVPSDLYDLVESII